MYREQSYRKKWENLAFEALRLIGVYMCAKFFFKLIHSWQSKSPEKYNLDQRWPLTFKFDNTFFKFNITYYSWCLVPVWRL